VDISDPTIQWHRLIKNGDLAAIRAHVENGGNVNLANRFGWTPLMLAACEGNSSIIDYLVAEGANVNAINNADASALAYAALKGQCSAIQSLLWAGASIDVRPHGVSLLDFSEKWGGHPSTARHLAILKTAGVHS
jgi:ankyrin repeat protein